MLQVNFAELRSVTLVREYGLAAIKDGEQIYFGWFPSAPWIHATFTQGDFSTQNGGGAASSATLQSPLDVTSVVCYLSCLIIHDLHHIFWDAPQHWKVKLRGIGYCKSRWFVKCDLVPLYETDGMFGTITIE